MTAVDERIATWADGAERANRDWSDVFTRPLLDCDMATPIGDAAAEAAPVVPLPVLRQPHPADCVWVYAGLAHQPVPEIKPPVTVCGIECGGDASLIPAELGGWLGLCGMCFGEDPC